MDFTENFERKIKEKSAKMSDLSEKENIFFDIWSRFMVCFTLCVFLYVIFILIFADEIIIYIGEGKYMKLK